jgi:hypothetical protein
MRVGLSIGAVLLTATALYAQLGADNKPMQPPKPKPRPEEQSGCGSAWWAKYRSLSKQVRSYNDARTQAIADADLDNEGTLDIILASSEPTFAPCSVQGDPTRKLNRVYIRFDADHNFEYEWEGNLIRGMRIYKEKRMIQTYGEKIDGSGWQQTTPYTIPEGR